MRHPAPSQLYASLYLSRKGSATCLRGMRGTISLRAVVSFGLLLLTRGQIAGHQTPWDAGFGSAATINSRTASALQQAAGPLQTAHKTVDVGDTASKRVGASLLAATTSEVSASDKAAGDRAAGDGSTPADTTTTAKSTASTATKTDSEDAAAPAPAPAVSEKTSELTEQASTAASDQSQVVKEAPPAEADGWGDINPEGACKQYISDQCDGVEFVDGQVADCLGDFQREVEAQAEDGDAGSAGLSDECNEEVMQFKINRNTNINKNRPLALACAFDAAKYCNMTWFSGYQNGSVIACLRDVREKLKPQCRKQLFKVQLDASYDYRADQMLYKACQKDAETLCPGVKPGGGRMQDCLRKQRLKLSWDCNGELFRKQIEDTDDIRLSVRLFRACLVDKRQYCADVAPGQAMAKQCLEEHLEELSSGCRTEMESMIEQRVRNFRLDSRLKRACQGEIYDTCAYLGDMDTVSDDDSIIINCLQDFSKEIKSKACQMQVHKYVELAAQDIRFDVPLADACYNDRMKLCANVPPGSARVIRCLQNQRDRLDVVCRTTLMSEEMKFSENIDFQYPMKRACVKEIATFCDGVPHGNARVIRCLQEAKLEKSFGKACRTEIEHYEQESAKDYRLNFRLYNTCKADIGQLCKEACQVQDGEICGGKVISCLSDSKESIKSQACRKEVTYLEKLEVNDFRTDIVLAEACRADVNKFCLKVEPGEGRVHKCLRAKAAQLSPACRKEELRLEAKEADNIQNNPTLLKTCMNERSLFCRGVAPGSARVFRCLAGNMASADFGKPCKKMIMQKLQRRDANWRLDPPLRKACREDVDRLCAEEDAQRSDTGAVKKCMISKHTELSGSCQQELGRSLHMSFFVWQPEGVVTEPCDADIQKLCLSGDAGPEVTPGAVSVCLSEIVDKMSAAESSSARHLLAEKASESSESEEHTEAKKQQHTPQQQKQQQKRQQKQQNEDQAEEPKQVPKRTEQNKAGTTTSSKQQQQQGQQQKKNKPSPRLSQQCYKLAVLAVPPQSQQPYSIKDMAYSMLTHSLGKVEEVTGLETVTRSKQGGIASISLTGWTAVAGTAALVLVVLGGATIAVRQYVGLGVRNSGYTLVTKQVPSS